MQQVSKEAGERTVLAQDLRNRFSPAIYALAVAIFAGFGLLLLPVLGLQYDEVMFADEFWRPQHAEWTVSFAGIHIPVMMMSYLGALKTWLYAPFLQAAAGNVWALRLPMLVLAAVTLGITGLLLSRIAAASAGWMVALLLATDVTFETTAVFDWGPVVIQNLLLASGLLLILFWMRNRSPRVLGLVGLLYGLALWNKALFVWNLSGMLAAAVVVALLDMTRAVSRRSLTLFLAGLILGALPLIVYNAGHRGETASEGLHLDPATVPAKADYLVRALNGMEAPVSMLSASAARPDAAERPFKDTILSWAVQQPMQPSSWRFIAGLVFIFAGFVTSDFTRQRWIGFFFLSGAIGWFESAITQNAGGWIHHAVLFWIPWYAAVATGAASLANSHRAARVGVWAAIPLLCLLGMRGEAITYANLLRFRPKPQWTNADAALMARLRKDRVKRVITTDWGIANVLDTESKGAIDSDERAFELNQGHFDSSAFSSCSSPACLVVTHPTADLLFPEAGRTLSNGLMQSGMQPVAESLLYDTHGFPAYRVFSIHARGSVAASPAAAPDTLIPTAPGISFTLTKVAGESSGSLIAVDLAWSVPPRKNVQVRVNSPNGQLFARSLGPSRSRTGKWVSDRMAFYLMDMSSNPPRALAEVIAHIQ